MIRPIRTHWLRPALGVAALLTLLLGCSTDSPTAPEQPGAAPAPTPSAVWRITVSVDPRELVAGSTEPAVITVRVRRASDNSAPPQGTTIIVSSSLGDLLSQGSGISSVVLSLLDGRGELFLYAGALTGSALITARLEGSVGQESLPIVAAIEPVVASFTFSNSDNNESVAFLNTSTGNPNRFRWEFGDGRSSTRENPTHVFPHGGDFVVRLTASKKGSSDTATQIVSVPVEDERIFIASIEPSVGPPSGGTLVTIEGEGFSSPLRVLFGGKLGDVQSVSSQRITVLTPPVELPTEDCDSNNDGIIDGKRTLDQTVSVTVELESGIAETISNGFTYDTTNTCVTGGM